MSLATFGDKFATGLGDILQLVAGTPLDTIKTRRAVNQESVDSIARSKEAHAQLINALQERGYNPGSLQAEGDVQKVKGQQLANEGQTVRNRVEKTSANALGGITPETFNAKRGVVDSARNAVLANKHLKLQEKTVASGERASNAQALEHAATVNQLAPDIKTQRILMKMIGLPTDALDKQIMEEDRVKSERLKLLTGGGNGEGTHAGVPQKSNFEQLLSDYLGNSSVNNQSSAPSNNNPQKSAAPQGNSIPRSATSPSAVTQKRPIAMPTPMSLPIGMDFNSLKSNLQIPDPSLSERQDPIEMLKAILQQGVNQY